MQASEQSSGRDTVRVTMTPGLSNMLGRLGNRDWWAGTHERPDTWTPPAVKEAVDAGE